MKEFVKFIESIRPKFEKLSRNAYLRSIREGFLAATSVLLFGSIFLLIAFIPKLFGVSMSPETQSLIKKPYFYSIGFLGLVIAGTTSKTLTDSFNRSMESTNQINNISTLLAGVLGFLLLASDSFFGGFTSEFVGSIGLIPAFVSAIITVNVFKICIKNNVTIKLHEEIPPNLAQTLKDAIPFSISILIMFLIDICSRKFFGENFASLTIQFLRPLFDLADSYIGLVIIYGAMTLFWFSGVHGPSIVEPIIAFIAYANLDANLMFLTNGMHANALVTPGLQSFVATIGGTGATFVVPFIMMWFLKSKQSKSVGRSSVFPTSFGVNEPVLFGTPLISNHMFAIPFLVTPIVNVFLFKFFVEFLGMNSFSYFLPWMIPGPLGLVMGTGFDKLSIVLTILILIVDTIIYYPFLRCYDKKMLLEESKIETNVIENEKNEKNEINEEQKVEKEIENNCDANLQKTISDKKNVLVLCAGGGTSGLLSNALNKAAVENNIKVDSAAGSYGAHNDILKDFDLVILAPQVASNYEDIKKDTDKLGIKLVKTQGVEYIKLTRNPKEALDFVLKQFSE